MASEVGAPGPYRPRICHRQPNPERPFGTRCGAGHCVGRTGDVDVRLSHTGNERHHRASVTPAWVCRVSSVNPLNASTNIAGHASRMRSPPSNAQHHRNKPTPPSPSQSERNC